MDELGLFDLNNLYWPNLFVWQDLIHVIFSTVFAQLDFDSLDLIILIQSMKFDQLDKIIWEK